MSKKLLSRLPEKMPLQQTQGVNTPPAPAAPGKGVADEAFPADHK
ncbi:TPA: hypothetical protein ACU64X_003532 [Escherichia coli]